MHERVYERDLKPNLLATQRGSSGQSSNKVERAGELSYRFYQRRTRQRLLSRFAPQARCFLNQARLGAMARQQLGLALNDFGELTFNSFRDTRVEYPSRLSQQCSVGRVLHKCVLDQISRVRWNALSEQQTGLD